MFTVKLYRGHNVRIVEGTEIKIHPCGKAEGAENDPSLRTNKFRELSVRTYEAKHETFFVGDIQESVISFHGPVDIYDVAYIENAHGATTETVRPY